MSSQHYGKGTRTAPASAARFKVADMTCDHCVGTIRKALEQKLPGVAVATSLETNEVTVAGDATIAEQGIRGAGYEPQLLSS